MVGLKTVAAGEVMRNWFRENSVGVDKVMDDLAYGASKISPSLRTEKGSPFSMICILEMRMDYVETHQQLDYSDLQTAPREEGMALFKEIYLWTHPILF